MDPYTRRPGRDEYDPFYGGYVALVPEGNILTTLAIQLQHTLLTLLAVAPERADYAYAPGKWTLKEVVGHMCDAERVFAYRILRFGRGDPQPLPGFDEKAWVPPGDFGRREVAVLADEFSSVRRATLSLLAGLPPEAWQRRGTASGAGISVTALAWIAAGHELHHLRILKLRYLTGATPTPFRT